MVPSVIKQTLHAALVHALCQAQPALGDAVAALPADQWAQLVATHLKLERPRQSEHGDYAVNVSWLAKHTRQAPPAIAATLLPLMPAAPLYDVSQVGGFLNFKLTGHCLAEALLHLVRTPSPGKNTSLVHQKVNLEYVSANPTGPLHLGHGRWAALGDSIRRVLQHNGATVCAEFYVNDYGKQMTHMANSLWFRCLEHLGLAPWPTVAEGEPPLPYYPGEYVKELAQAYTATAEGLSAIQAGFAQVGAEPLTATDSPQLLDTLRLYCKEQMLANQRALLATFRVSFDQWTFESDFHARGQVEQTLARLKANGHTFEDDGALWLRSTQWDDEKDRVLIKSDGSYTYLAADIVCHADKLNRPAGCNRLLDIWGADHHGYVPRMRAAIGALGYDPAVFEVILGQLVSLVEGGEKARMGKRRKMLTLADIVDEVGVDATRFWLVNRSADHPIEFDVDLAKSRTDENPVYYVQYAHARACSILRMATEPAADVAEGVERPARFAMAQLEAFTAQWQADPLATALFAPLADDTRALAAVRELILLLDAIDDKVMDAGRLAAPYLLVRFCLDVAAQFHSFYGACRVLTDSDETTQARLLLVQAVARVMAQGLDLVGVTAPSKM
jgi:arginyl-tRNA synthetase